MEYTPGSLGTLLLKPEKKRKGGGEASPEGTGGLSALFSSATQQKFSALREQTELVKIKEAEKRPVQKIPTGKKKYKKWQQEQEKLGGKGSTTKENRIRPGESIEALEQSPLLPTKKKERKKKAFSKSKLTELSNEGGEKVHEDLGDSDDGESTKVGLEENNGKDERTIFVGNIPISVKMSQLQKMFKKYGQIESMRMRSVNTQGVAVDEHGNQRLVKKVAIYQKKFGEEKDSFNAYVVFKDAASVGAALAANNEVVGGHHLRVDRAASGGRGDPARTLFLGNLDFKVTEEEVRAFVAAGLAGGGGGGGGGGGDAAVESVRLVRDRDTQLGRGFGYVLLRDRAALAKALRLDGQKLRKREVRARACGKRLKSGGGGGVGGDADDEERPPSRSFQGRAGGALRRVQGRLRQRGLDPVLSLVSSKKRKKTPSNETNEEHSKGKKRKLGREKTKEHTDVGKAGERTKDTGKKHKKVGEQKDKKNGGKKKTKRSIGDGEKGSLKKKNNNKDSNKTSEKVYKSNKKRTPEQIARRMEKKMKKRKEVATIKKGKKG